MDRVQTLILQISKRVFLSKDNSVIRFEDLVCDAEKLDLSEVIVVGLSYDSISVRYKKYFNAKEKFSMGEFLEEAWEVRYKNPLDEKDCIGGTPTKIILGDNLANYLDGNFFQWLNDLGIEYEIISDKKRNYASLGNHFQEYPEINHTLNEDEKVNPADLKLTLDILNKKVIQKEKIRIDVYKELKNTIKSRVWRYYLMSIDDVCFTHKCIDDTSVFLKKTCNDRKIFNPKWVEHSIVNNTIKYGYMINNYSAQSKPMMSDGNEEFVKTAISCMESVWHLYDESMLLKIKNLKQRRWINFQSFNENEYQILLKDTGIKSSVVEDTTYVYDFSKLKSIKLERLWNHLIQPDSIVYEVVGINNNLNYRLFFNIVGNKTYIFLTKRKYKKWESFDNGKCRKYDMFNIQYMNTEKLSLMIQDYENGNINAFDDIKPELRSFQMKCG